MSKAQEIGAIIVAAGESQRMNGIDKVKAELGGKPLLSHTIDTFQHCEQVNRIVVVVHRKNIDWCEKLVTEAGWSKVSRVCPGGERRQDSVAEGLKYLGRCDWVIVHDGARPLVTEELIISGLKAAGPTGVAVAAVPVKDTIKIAGKDKIVRETPPRQNIWAVQTPQIFRFDIIAEAYRHAQNDVTDDASLVEQLGHKVKLYMGSYDNIKVTTPEDLALAEILWQKHGK